MAIAIPIIILAITTSHRAYALPYHGTVTPNSTWLSRKWCRMCDAFILWYQPSCKGDRDGHCLADTRHGIFSPLTLMSGPWWKL